MAKTKSSLSDFSYMHAQPATSQRLQSWKFPMQLQGELRGHTLDAVRVGTDGVTRIELESGTVTVWRGERRWIVATAAGVGVYET